MGILNSLIIPLEYKEKSLECLKGHEYKIIFAEKSEEISNIKDDLVLENNDFVEEYKSQIEETNNIYVYLGTYKYTDEIKKQAHIEVLNYEGVELSE